MISAEQILTTGTAYLARHPDEADRLAELTAALTRSADPTSRKTFTGHVTCSALVADEAHRILHIHHNHLQLWLPPGGHLEPTDTDLSVAAQRELTEETGIPATSVRLIDEIPIDIDVHRIPANPARDEPDHWHFDLCYPFALTGDADIVLQLDEVQDFTWLPLASVEPSWIDTRLKHLQF
jgi:8-oxo-dGTP pyrophosphatase MutT (NUDIX family)